MALSVSQSHSQSLKIEPEQEQNSLRIGLKRLQKISRIGNSKSCDTEVPRIVLYLPELPAPSILGVQLLVGASFRVLWLVAGQACSLARLLLASD